MTEIAERPDGADDGKAGTATASDLESGSGLYADVSRAMVRLYKEQFGRGPVKAKTRFADSDTLLRTLEGSLTPAEQNLVAMGEDARLRDIRMFFQHAGETRFREVVEELTGRRVIAFVSGMDTGRDVSAEVFYLEPFSSHRSLSAGRTGRRDGFDSTRGSMWAASTNPRSEDA